MSGGTRTAAAFLLTGGKSSRMGRDKALLELAGKPMVVRMVELLRPLVAEVKLVGTPERYCHLGIPVLADLQPGRGPLGGIVTALSASTRDWNLVVACDLPFLESSFLELLLHRALDTTIADAVVPQSKDPASREGVRWQPLCAVYHRRCLPVFERILTGPKPKIALAFQQVRVLALAPQELARFAFPERLFKNMNTAADYRDAKRLLG